VPDRFLDAGDGEGARGCYRRRISTAEALQQPQDQQLPLRFPLHGSRHVDLFAALGRHYLLHRHSPEAA
jgi:hypothetical protein